jgi:chemotaxis response regulator CheB
MSSPAAYPIISPVLALVTSAGGLNALTQVLGRLPAHLPAAILVVQHIDPEHASSLPAILDDRTALGVRSATDGDLLIQGTVLVAPPAQHLPVTSEPALDSSTPAGSHRRAPRQTCCWPPLPLRADPRPGRRPDRQGHRRASRDSRDPLLRGHRIRPK